MHVRLVVFAEGGSDYQLARMRLEKQGLQSETFDSIYTYNAEVMRSKFPGFHRAHEDFIRSNQLGYGKWIWKPFLIWKNLIDLNDGDFVVYLDAGCEINNMSALVKDKWQEYLEFAEASEILAFQLRNNQFEEHPVLNERTWNRIDLINELSLDKDQLSANQIEANFLIIKNNSKTRKVIQEWYEFCFKNDYKYLFEPEDFQRFPDYKDYRYDQSILSALLKKYCFETLPNENYFHPNWFHDGRDFPVWTARNRTGESIVPNGIPPMRNKVQFLKQVSTEEK